MNWELEVYKLGENNSVPETHKPKKIKKPRKKLKLEFWEKMTPLGKLLIVIWLFLIILIVVMNAIGEYFLCYTLVDFTINLIGVGNATIGC